jgi:hypothetical protein
MLAFAILDLISDAARLKEMGRRGREAVLYRFNWKINVGVLKRTLNHYVGVKNRQAGLMAKKLAV